MHDNDVNFVLITVDSLRPDHLGCCGYEKKISANIDSLAAEGVLFTQAISQASFTAASLASLVTATHCATHGVRKWGDCLPPSMATLSQVLRERHFATAAFCAHSDLFQDIGLYRGFDRVAGQRDWDGQDITDEGIGFIRQMKARRFFLWVHYYDTHIPYRAPWYVRIPSEEGSSSAAPGGAEVNSVASYDRAIKYVDLQVGRIMQQLRQLRLEKRTVCIVTADHGESLGEHWLRFTHGKFLYDELVKVPLVFYADSRLQSRIVDRQVRLVDIFPTMLSFMGLRRPQALEGVSLIPLMVRSLSFRRSLVAYSEIDHLRSLRTPRWKLIWHSILNDVELYDLERDPDELLNLASVDQPRARRLKKKLLKHLSRRTRSEERAVVALSDVQKQNLKSLGYSM